MAVLTTVMMVVLMGDMMVMAVVMKAAVVFYFIVAAGLFDDIFEDSLPIKPVIPEITDNQSVIVNIYPAITKVQYL